MDYIEHIKELRHRLLKTLCVWAVIFIILLFYAHDLLAWFATPILNAELKLIATQITAPVFVPLMVVFYVSVICVVPFALYQLWRFILPALYMQERIYFKIFFLPSIFLFYLGGTFALLFVLPMIIHVMAFFSPAAILFMPDINHYLMFMVKMILIFGVCFELPIIMLLLSLTQIVTLAQMKSFRRYWIVAAFILGMVLTPPDVISQIMLAIPLCLLYEAGIGLIILFCKYNQLEYDTSFYKNEGQ